MTPHWSCRVIASLLAAASLWSYVLFVLRPWEVTYAAVHQQPRGNLSDLYPRWLGARELLLHGRDPYAADITREIQTGYYGRPLDATRPNDPRDQQAFAYPVYVVFVLAPTVKMPFATVQRIFLWLLVILTAGSVPLWMKAVVWRIDLAGLLIWIVLTLGCFPAIQGFKLQQLTLLVAGLLALAMCALAGEFLVLAGICLAVASIKPQLVALPVLMLCMWSLGNWRERQRFVWGLGATTCVLFAGGELLAPGWVTKFRAASAAYWQYTGGGKSVLDFELTPLFGRMLSALLVGVLVYFAWRLRRSPVRSAEFAWLVALTMATTLLVIPMVAPYNQLLLLPALMVLVRGVRELWAASRLSRFIVFFTAVSLFWPWIASLALTAALLFLPPTTVQKAWSVPLYTNFTFPTLTLALLLAGRRILCGASRVSPVW